MTGAEGAGAALVEVGLWAIDRAAPRGLAFVRSWMRGRQILVVGPPRAGKTTFIDYLQYGLFEPEKHTAKTLKTSRSARFDVRMG